MRTCNVPGCCLAARHVGGMTITMQVVVCAQPGCRCSLDACRVKAVPQPFVHVAKVAARSGWTHTRNAFYCPEHAR